MAMSNGSVPKLSMRGGNVSYKEILKEAISNSGKSLNLITKECYVKGLNISSSYLSRLQNGKMPPASDKANKIVAEVINIDADKLILAAYREKIPPEILKKLAKSS